MNQNKEQSSEKVDEKYTCKVVSSSSSKNKFSKEVSPKS